MTSPVYDLHPPHFAGSEGRPAERRITPAGELPEAAGFAQPATGSTSLIAPLLLRAAECLTAALFECTAEAGLNEARYRVLTALQLSRGGECSQSMLADLLLQSESNLSTLLERMSADGLIVRARSQLDRRRCEIRMTESGYLALSRADRARASTVSRLTRRFGEPDADLLTAGLQRLIGELESTLSGGGRQGGAALRRHPTGPLVDQRPIATGAAATDR